MKRQGSHQATLEAYFGKRSHVSVNPDGQKDETLVASMDKTALEIIADAYAYVEDNEQNAADVEIDRALRGNNANVSAVSVAKADDIVTDHTGCASQSRCAQKVQLRKKKENPATLKINYSDELSLFRAIEVAMFYHETGEGRWQMAERYSRKEELDLAASILRARAKIERKSAYGLDDVMAVFEYLQQKYPDEYRILVFTPTSHTKAVYNSGNNARYNICLYYHNGHFDLIKKFFRKRHYCVEYEKAYGSQASHAKCKTRCRQCFGIGHGFPCEGNWPIELECPDCHQLFANQRCMDAHKPFSCNTFHRCVYCKLHYRARAEHANQGHRCDETFCRRCYKKHRKDPGNCVCPGAQSQTQQVEERTESAT
ncbi:hypothetical protein AAVH_23607 [Aphelenchoides avenae]|nr:hypothetical protein AAVH_23606 [Aphelenchus avenae]KAH7709130.1 hypothetical protein AAVH_23607 [Aphelenchus avenae]